MRPLILKVMTSVDGKKLFTQSDQFPSDSLDTGLPWALATLDQIVLRTLADSALLVDCIAIQFQLPGAIKRGDLAKLWIDSVIRLHEVLDIVPEDLPTDIHNALYKRQQAKLPR